MAKQYPLDLNLNPDYSRTTFLSGASNEEGLGAIENANIWANNMLALIGPKGSGKTHLGHIWAHEHNAVCLDIKGDFTPNPKWKDQYIWIDDASRAAEFTLFTLINLAIAGKIKGLLLTDREPPSAWPVQIPDLHSRLKNISIVRLQEQGDDILTAILEKMFKDRGLKVSDALVSYLLTNTGRSVNALRSLIIDLDTEAAAQKAEVTRSFAVKFLQGKLL